ncbi:MAG: HRDC domain-containing protein, partial [Chloroflexota bacterium]|nr:HRDC domain-containing protein [Chloroflexota bacterium]
SGIVYVNSRHKSETLAYQLREAGIAAEAYHAGLADRGGVQDRFMSDKTRVVIATVAFGMGIDKADIRFIVHFHPSRSLAAYYQEVGRAGRNGQPSQGVLFYSNNDWANLRRWAKADEHSVDFLERVYAAVATQLGVDIQPAEESKGAGERESGGAGEQNSQLAIRRERETGAQLAIGPVDARRLQQVLNSDETTVRVAVSILERAELLGRSFDIPQEIEITVPRKLPAAAGTDTEFAHLLKGLALRPGGSATFKIVDIAGFMDWSLHDVEAILLDWALAGYLTSKNGRRAMLIDLPPRPAADAQAGRHRLERLLAQSSALAQRRIDEMIGYATAESCRHGYISAHFGSPPRNRCEVCDYCTGIRPAVPVPLDTPLHLPDDADIEPMIIDCLISLPKPVGRGGLARIMAGSLRAPVTPDKARHHGRLKGLGETQITDYIDDLLEQHRLRQYERQGYMVLAPTMRGRAEAEIWLVEHPEMASLGDAPEPIGEEAEAVSDEGAKYTSLQKALWLWRRRSAEQQSQPPYVIMSNELMLRIAELRPQNEDELATLPGMGAQRLQHYGPTILDLVKLYPAQAGDGTLIETQRGVQAQTANEIKQKFQEKAPAVSPQIERRIFMKLQELRQKKAIHERSKPYLVASNPLLKLIAQTAPTTSETLEQILGFRSSGFRDEVAHILAVITQARQG